MQISILVELSSMLSLPNQYRLFLPRFYRLASVAVLSNMMVPLAGLCDAAFLGHLKDINQLTGVILGGILFDYIYRVLKIFRNSTNTLTANAVGQDDSVAVWVSVLRCGLIALVIAGIILVLQYPIHKLGFAILSGSSDTEAAGLDYFNARIWGAPAVLLNFVLFGWFLGREISSIVFLMSLIGNGTNVVFDYLMIYKWGWESMGAGLATALSQYLALLVGLIAMVLTGPRHAWKPAVMEMMELQGLKSAIVLKSNILVRFLVLISAYAIFTNISASFGAELLAENGLLLQIALLSQFTVQGVGMTSQTLIGNFKGKDDTNRILPVLHVALITALFIALTFALGVILFPDMMFNLLTNHSEISHAMHQYNNWLLPLLALTALAFILESYFIGVKDGKTLRNGALVGFLFGFSPLMCLAAYQHSEHLLWSTLTTYMGVLSIFLCYQLSKSHKSLLLKAQEAQPTR